MSPANPGTPSDFFILRDWRKVEWDPTIQLNFARWAMSGAVFSILLLFGFGGAVPDLIALLQPVLMPLLLLVLLPLLVVGDVLGHFRLPFGIFFTYFHTLVNLFGDPFLYLLYARYPDHCPVRTFRPFNFVPFIFVVKPESEVLDEGSEIGEPA